MKEFDTMRCDKRDVQAFTLTVARQKEDLYKTCVGQSPKQGIVYQTIYTKSRRNKKRCVSQFCLQ